MTASGNALAVLHRHWHMRLVLIRAAAEQIRNYNECVDRWRGTANADQRREVDASPRRDLTAQARAEHKGILMLAPRILFRSADELHFDSRLEAALLRRIDEALAESDFPFAIRPDFLFTEAIESPLEILSNVL